SSPTFGSRAFSCVSAFHAAASGLSIHRFAGNCLDPVFQQDERKIWTKSTERDKPPANLQRLARKHIGNGSGRHRLQTKHGILPPSAELQAGWFSLQRKRKPRDGHQEPIVPLSSDKADNVVRRRSLGAHCVIAAFSKQARLAGPQS